VSRQTPHPIVDWHLTADEFIEIWRAHDEPITPKELSQLGPRRPPWLLVIARCITGLLILAVVLSIGPLLRAVGDEGVSRDAMACYAPPDGRSAALPSLARQPRYGFAPSPCGASRGCDARDGRA